MGELVILKWYDYDVFKFLVGKMYLFSSILTIWEIVFKLILNIKNEIQHLTYNMRIKLYNYTHF